MILDHLDSADRYFSLHPGFSAAFDFLRKTALNELPLGKHAIDGERLFVIVARDAGRGHDGAVLEAHRKYIDIQFVIAGDEQMGWRDLSSCREATLAYDAERDLAFFGDRPRVWFATPPEHFVVFWPDDAHAPLAGTGELHKAVVKVAVDW